MPSQPLRSMHNEGDIGVDGEKPSLPRSMAAHTEYRSGCDAGFVLFVAFGSNKLFKVVGD